MRCFILPAVFKLTSILPIMCVWNVFGCFNVYSWFKCELLIFTLFNRTYKDQCRKKSAIQILYLSKRIITVKNNTSKLHLKVSWGNCTQSTKGQCYIIIFLLYVNGIFMLYSWSSWFTMHYILIMCMWYLYHNYKLLMLNKCQKVKYFSLKCSE